MNKNALFVILGVVVIGGLAFAGQALSNKIGENIGEEIAEQAIEQANGGNADVNVAADGSVDVTTNDGSISYGTNVALPSGFPSSVPAPKSGDLTTSYSATEDGKTSYSIVYTVSGSAAAVASDYKAQLQAAGFTVTIDATTTTNGTTTSGLEATKDNLTVTAGAVGTGDQTSLTIFVVQN